MTIEPSILTLIIAFVAAALWHAHHIGYQHGHRQGVIKGYPEGYNVGIEEQQEVIDAQLTDIGTLNQRITTLAAALDHEQEQCREAIRRLKDLGTKMIEQDDLFDDLADELDAARARQLTADEERVINRAAALLQQEAKRFSRTGTNKVNHAATAHESLTAILQRRAPEARAAA